MVSKRLGEGFDGAACCHGRRSRLHRQSGRFAYRPILPSTGWDLILKSTTHDLPETIRPSSWVIDELVSGHGGPFDAVLRLLAQVPSTHRF